jgi:hypothetical protein
MRRGGGPEGLEVEQLLILLEEREGALRSEPLGEWKKWRKVDAARDSGRAEGQDREKPAGFENQTQNLRHPRLFCFGDNCIQVRFCVRAFDCLRHPPEWHGLRTQDGTALPLTEA